MPLENQSFSQTNFLSCVLIYLLLIGESEGGRIRGRVGSCSQGPRTRLRAGSRKSEPPPRGVHSRAVSCLWCALGETLNNHHYHQQDDRARLDELLEDTRRPGTAKQRLLHTASEIITKLTTQLLTGFKSTETKFNQLEEKLGFVYFFFFFFDLFKQKFKLLIIIRDFNRVKIIPI